MRDKVKFMLCMALSICMLGCFDNSAVSLDQVKADIQTWQRTRWQVEQIEKVRKEKGRVSPADLNVTARYPEFQSMFDALVAEYVICVNVLDAIALSDVDAAKAWQTLRDSVSMEDVNKMVANVDQTLKSAKAIKSKAGWSDALPIGEDLVSIVKLGVSMTSGAEILKQAFGLGSMK